MSKKKEKKYLIDNPALMEEWNWEKNKELGLDPKTLTLGSGKKVWWKCDKGHEWESHIYNRITGHGCPFCSGRYVVQGENDLSTLNPKLANEWNYEKNGELKPENFTVNSGEKVWWKCKKGHEWRAKIYHRNNGTGCPFCKSERHTSFPEFAFLFYLKKYGLEAKQSYKELGYELDVFIPSMKIAVEYDGAFWHKNKGQKDLKKNQKCKNDGIKLYRIRENLPLLNDYSIDYIVDKNQKNLAEVIRKILSEIIGINVDVDLKKDAVEIENLREYTEKENSLLYTNPTLAKEWNYEKNGKLKPENVSPSSNKKVWWKCKKGHEWQAGIYSRIAGNNCPICSNKQVLKGYNDLATISPELAKEWNYEKNGDLKPEDFTANAAAKVWWKCKKGHEWQAAIFNRSNGRGCPFCSSRKILIGYNDLETINPTLAKEWNYEKNGELKPKDFMPNSNKNVWWKCDKGHEWQATIHNRNNGNGCPYCLGRNVVKGENDLATLNSKLVSEWNYKKNGDLMPEEFTANSGKKVWWKCDKGHEWQATIIKRNKGAGCPYCSGRKKLKD